MQTKEAFARLVAVGHYEATITAMGRTLEALSREIAATLSIIAQRVPRS
jgi:hypothetical protein